MTDAVSTPDPAARDDAASTPDPAARDDAASTPDPAARDDAASTPDPAARDGAAGFSQPVLWRDNCAALSDEDVLALLDRLGVAGTHDPEEEQEAIAAAEWDARQARDDGSPVSPVLVVEHLPTGPGLAALLAQDTPAEASDWDLPGLAAGYRRVAAWAQARELGAAAEIAARRAAANPKIGTTADGRPVSLPPEAAAEVALELRMSQCGASAWTALGCQLRWTLPATGAALAAGTIDLLRARIIAEATAVLSGEHAARLEARVLPRAGDQTTGQLRAAVRRAVLAVDPEGAERRRADTERLARICLYPGEEGTATLTGSCLPGVHAAAAMARISAMARALKSAGADGGIDLLRAHVFLGLLLGTMPLIPPPADGPPDDPPADDGTDSPRAGDGTDGALANDGTDEPPASGDADGPPDTGGRGVGQSGAAAAASTESEQSPQCPGGDDSRPTAWSDIPCPLDEDAPREADRDVPDGPGFPGMATDDEECDRAAQSPPPHWPPLPACLPAPGTIAPGAGAPGPGGTLRPPAGLLDILIGWSAITGQAFEPARLGRIGPIAAWQARQLLTLAARGSGTEWRVVVTDNDGRAVAVERARPSWHPRPRTGEAGPAGTGLGSTAVVGTAGTGLGSTSVVGRVTVAIRASWLGTARATAPGGPSPITGITAAVLSAAARAAARARAGHDAAVGGCVHTMASAAYRPPPRIREHIAARDITCRFTTCGQPAWRADLDHTVPWHKGGRTCPCNLGGFCRTHHKIKALPGWQVEQSRPGTFRWTTPAGRSYLAEPDPYPV